VGDLILDLFNCLRILASSILVAVGMRVSSNPPHRSRRAELPHRTLASGDDAKTNYGIRVTDSGGRKPLGNQTLHPFPFQVMLLAAAPQNLHPHPTDLLVKGTDAMPIHQNSEVADMP
jgi:hypothetical protein